jgi:hypothetical protein
MKRRLDSGASGIRSVCLVLMFRSGVVRACVKCSEFQGFGFGPVT